MTKFSSNAKPLWVCLLAVAVLLAAGCGSARTSGSDTAGAAPGNTQSNSATDKTFDSVPIAEPGELAGHLLYVPYDRPGCELRRYDLATGVDEGLGKIAGGCDLWGFTASRDGTRVAWRTSGDEIVVQGTGGDVLRLKTARREASDKDIGLNFGPFFSSDSRYVSYCAPGGGAPYEFRVVDLSTGDAVSELPGSCKAALTANGLAELRDGGVFLNGEPLDLGPQDGPAMSSVEPAFQIASDTRGAHIALLSHGVVSGETKTTAVVNLYDLEGRPLGRAALKGSLVRGGMTIRLGILRLAPSGRSALVLWGDILQLMPFGSSDRFPLLYGEDGPALGFVDYSADGRFAVLGREDFRPIAFGEDAEAPPPADAVVLDEGTFEPLFRLPIHSNYIAWSG